MGRLLQEFKRKHANNLVVMDNELVMAKMEGHAFDMKLFEILVSRINKDDTDFYTQRIYYREFLKACNSTIKDYDKVRKAVYRLASSTFFVEAIRDSENQDSKKYGMKNLKILDNAFLTEFEKGKKNRIGFMDLRLHDDLKPYLLNLKSNFTKYDIRNILPLNPYAIRLFKRLKSFEYIGTWKIGYERLLRQLNAEGKFSDYSNFRKRVLVEVKNKHIEFCDIKYEFKLHRIGRIPYEIEFTIYNNTPNWLISNKEFSDMVETIGGVKDEVVNPDVYRKIEGKVSKEKYIHWLENYPQERINEVINYTLKREYEGKIIKNYFTYIDYLLETKANVLNNEEVKKLEAQKKKQERQKKEKIKVELETKMEEDQKLLVEKENEIIARIIDSEGFNESEVIAKAKKKVPLIARKVNWDTGVKQCMKETSGSALLRPTFRELYPEFFKELEPLRKKMESIK